MKRYVHKHVIVGSFCAALLWAASARGAGYGLMVGIDRYDPTYVSNPLNSCVNDANGFKQKLLSDSSRWQSALFTTLTDSAATKTAIRNKLASLAATAVAGDVVVYFQSSHGGQNSGTDTFLCTYNASYQDEELAADLTAFKTGVSVIIVIDACHSAGMFKDVAGVAASSDAQWNFAQNVMDKMQVLRAKSATLMMAKGASVGWITAANYNEYSLAGEPYSLFVGYVLAGFDYGDANSNGQVTFLELYNYASPLAIADAALYGNPQHPQVLNTSLLEATVAKGAAIDTVVPLADALDEADLTWTTGGATNWYGQTGVSYDGADAGRSGAITHGQETWLQTTVNGPGALSYKWKASSEKNGDYLKFYCDGVAQGAGLSGETNWTAQAWALSAGAHTVKWVYSKNSSVSSGSDCGWVDQVVWLPAYTVTFDPEGGTVAPESKVVYAGSTYGALPTPVRAGFLFGGWWTGDNGTGAQVASDSALAAEANHTLHAKWSEIIELGRALDVSGLEWTTGGATNWFGETLVTSDGEDAAQSSPIAHSLQTWMQTTVTGPVTVGFLWKVSSEAGYDFLRFSIDGVEQAGKISGETGWAQKSYALAGGKHTLKWVYSKDASVSSGSDCGWVDQLTLSAGYASFSQEAVITSGEGSSGTNAFSAIVPVWGEGPVSVTVSAVAASATAADYVFASTGAVLTWEAGESGPKNVVVPIKGDTLAEGNELFYLALGKAVGGTISAPEICSVVIRDDDASVASKGPYVSGVATPSEGGFITGAGYCPSGKTVSLTAAAAAGWTFLCWENGYQGATRTVTAAEAAAAACNGAMRCQGFFKRTAELALPTSENPGPRQARVGVAFSMSLPVSSECLPKVVISGLPAGLSYNASAVKITGVPTAAGTFAVTFKASNAAGSSVAQTFTITVSPLPAWAQGSFNGTVGFYREDGLREGGLATMSVSPLGFVSGKLSFRGTNFTFSASSYSTAEDGVFGLKVTAAAGSVAWPLELSIWQYAATYDGGGSLPETLGAAAAAVPNGWLEMFRNVWKDAPMVSVATHYAGYYTAKLPPSEGAECGSGFLTLTVDKLGNVKAAAKLADGTALTLSGVLILGYDARVYTVLHNVPTAYKGGAFFGEAEFVRPEDGGPIYIKPLNGCPLFWASHNPQATSEYGAGFERALGLSGGWYDTVGNLYRYYADKVLSVEVLGPGEPTMLVSTNRYTSAWYDPSGLVIAPVTNAAGVLTGMKAPVSGTPTKVDGKWVYDLANNTAGMTFTLVRATGLFSGTSKVWFDYGATHTYKSVTFQGALTPVREDRGDGCEGGGYFLWADKGSYRSATGLALSYVFSWSYNYLLLSDPAP